MKKWLLVFLLLLAAFWAGGKYGSAKATAHAKALADTVAAIRDTAAVQRLALDAHLLVIDSLDRRADSLDALARKWRRVATIAQAEWDAVWEGATADTTPPSEIRRLGNAAIAACQQNTASCEERLALAQEKGDSLRRAVHKADSLAGTWERAADASGREADEWRKVAAGPLLTLSGDGLFNFKESDWKLAADAALGRGRLKGLVRLDVGPGNESCDFDSDGATYGCSTPTDIGLWVGVRYKF